MSKLSRENLLELVGTISGGAAGTHAGKLVMWIMLSNYDPRIRIPAEIASRLIGFSVGAIIGNIAGKTADLFSK